MLPIERQILICNLSVPRLCPG